MGRIAPDADLWRWAMRDVAPLPGRALPMPMPPPPPTPDRGHPARPLADAGETPAVRSPPSRPPTPPAPSQPLNRFAGVDRATAERVKRGRYPLEGSLDLHGMTQEEAHRALTAFIATSRAAGKRCVLIITGNGRSSGGVLKAAVPRWLAEPGSRRHVLGLATARPQHGGAGALYVLLRRPPP